jgi:hypothetical protein
MTRKDFELIAAVLRADASHLARTERTSYRSMSDWEKGAYDQWHTTVLAMADALATTNPAFNRDRFLTACGVST